MERNNFRVCDAASVLPSCRHQHDNNRMSVHLTFPMSTGPSRTLGPVGRPIAQPRMADLPLVPYRQSTEGTHQAIETVSALPRRGVQSPTKQRVFLRSVPRTVQTDQCRLTLPHLPRVTHLSRTVIRGLWAMHWTSREGIIEQWRNEWFIKIQEIWFHNTEELLHAEMFLEASERIDIFFSVEISRRDAILREYDRILHTLIKPHGAICRGISAETLRYRRQVVRAKLLAMLDELAHQRWSIEQQERNTRFHYNLLCEVGARSMIAQEEGNRRTAIETECRYQETMQIKLSLAIGFLTVLEQRFRIRRCGMHIVQHHDMLSHALQVDETMRRVALDRDNLFTMRTSMTAHCILFMEAAVITHP